MRHPDDPQLNLILSYAILHLISETNFLLSLIYMCSMCFIFDYFIQTIRFFISNDFPFSICLAFFSLPFYSFHFRFSFSFPLFYLFFFSLFSVIFFFNNLADLNSCTFFALHKKDYDIELRIHIRARNYQRKANEHIGNRYTIFAVCRRSQSSLGSQCPASVNFRIIHVIIGNWPSQLSLLSSKR